MPNWSNIEKIYLYDGTFNGLLTIVFDSYLSKTIPLNIISESEYTFNLLDSTEKIFTDEEKSQRIFNGVVKNISYDALYYSYYAFLSNGKDKEINILKYLVNGFLIGPKIDTMLSIDYVFNVQIYKKRMLFESHRLKGLLRFIELNDNLYYASIHPDNNVVEDLGQHFVKRLPTQNFIIHDKIKNIMFLYDTNQYKIIDAALLPNIDISEVERKYQDLWKAFYKTIAIKERTNPRLQMQYMPKKYWNDLIEIP